MSLISRSINKGELEKISKELDVNLQMINNNRIVTNMVDDNPSVIASFQQQSHQPEDNILSSSRIENDGNDINNLGNRIDEY